MLNNCYKKTKKSFQKNARERYQNFYEEEKDKKCQYACERTI